MKGKEMKSALIGAVLGSLLGGVFTYIASLKVLDKQLKIQTAREFVSRHYLPLAGLGLEFHAISKQPGMDRRVIGETIQSIEKALENIVRSGVILIIHRVDAKLAGRIMEMRIYLIQKRSIINDGPDKATLAEVTRKMEQITSPLFRLSISRLAEEYSKIQEEPWFKEN